MVFLLLLTAAAVLALGHSVSPEESFTIVKRASGLKSRDMKPFSLRIMPLGASITEGYGSTDGNGYREYLWRQLRYKGWEVDMVGNKQNGNMEDNDHEGHYGFRIDQISAVANKSFHYQPNLILINVGTNDALQDYNINTAGKRVDSLIEKLFGAIPGTTIILSTLLPNTHQQTRVDVINKQYRKLAVQRRKDGDNVVLAEMSHFIKPDQLVDGIHPTDVGYKEMAAVWWASIEAVDEEGMLQRPNDIDILITGNVSSKQTTTVNISNPDLPYYSAIPQPLSNYGRRKLRNWWHLLLVVMLPFCY
ncbi:SGNH hydrolase-type esterase domain-containing protein [Aspergillus ambiguus]|uniref:SGNH/GDSL hydrolase family protein n=1 Tax=Aspergillus ambiguus TaxID=176160 RepID=UPI003CCE31A1